MYVEGMLNPNCFQMIFDFEKGLLYREKGQIFTFLSVKIDARVYTRYANEHDCWLSHYIHAALGKLWTFVLFCFQFVVWNASAVSNICSYTEPKHHRWSTYHQFCGFIISSYRDVCECNLSTMANTILWWHCQTSYSWTVWILFYF